MGLQFSRGECGTREGKAVILIKIGSSFLNLEHATEIRDTGVDLEVFFRDSNRATTLRGGEAERLRQWLTSRADDLNGKGEGA